MSKCVMVVMGTRPEAIKMVPVIKELAKRPDIDGKVLITAQHRTMLDDVLQRFQVEPDYDLDVMEAGQSLADLTVRLLSALTRLLKEVNPDLVLVHGDTTTAFVAALACFYQVIPVAHVEAGLRTYNLHAPYPEEFNRQAIDSLATYHFAPTTAAYETLIREGKDKTHVWLTGNTVIDALLQNIRSDYAHELLDWVGENRLILVTAHRRETLGAKMMSMLQALRRIVESHPDVRVVYPVHLNPVVQETAQAMLGSHDRIRLVEPLNVIDFQNIMARAHFILTDSGGIQEEAPSLGTPVLVMRDHTERPEAVEAGSAKIVGTTAEGVFAAVNELLANDALYRSMCEVRHVYGDGKAAKRIVDVIEGIVKMEETS